MSNARTNQLLSDLSSGLQNRTERKVAQADKEAIEKKPLDAKIAPMTVIPTVEIDFKISRVTLPFDKDKDLAPSDEPVPLDAKGFVYGKPVFLDKKTFVRTCYNQLIKHIPTTLQRCQIDTTGEATVLDSKILLAPNGDQLEVDELRYLSIDKRNSCLFGFHASSPGEVSIIDSDSLQVKELHVLLAHPDDLYKYVTHPEFRFSYDNQFTLMHFAYADKNAKKHMQLGFFDFLENKVGHIDMNGKYNGDWLSFAIANKKTIIVLSHDEGLFTDQLVIKIGKIDTKNKFNYSQTYKLPINYRHTDSYDTLSHLYKLVCWSETGYFAVISKQEEKIFIFRINQDDKIVLINEFQGSLKDRWDADSLLQDFLIFYDAMRKCVVGYNPIINSMVVFTGLEASDCKYLLVSKDRLLLIKGNNMTCVDDFPLEKTRVHKWLVDAQLPTLTADVLGVIAEYSCDRFFSSCPTPTCLAPANKEAESTKSPFSFW